MIGSPGESHENRRRSVFVPGVVVLSLALPFGSMPLLAPCFTVGGWRWTRNDPTKSCFLKGIPLMGMNGMVGIISFSIIFLGGRNKFNDRRYLQIRLQWNWVRFTLCNNRCDMITITIVREQWGWLKKMILSFWDGTTRPLRPVICRSFGMESMLYK